MKQGPEKAMSVVPQEEIWIQRHTDLSDQFTRYCLEHPEILEQMPDDSVLCMQVEGDDEFNTWARSWIQKSAKKSVITYITVKKLRPIRSLIEKVEIELA